MNCKQFFIYLTTFLVFVWSFAHIVLLIVYREDVNIPEISNEDKSMIYLSNSIWIISNFSILFLLMNVCSSSKCVICKSIRRCSDHDERSSNLLFVYFVTVFIGTIISSVVTFKVHLYLYTENGRAGRSTSDSGGRSGVRCYLLGGVAQT